MSIWNREPSPDVLRAELAQCEQAIETALKHYEKAGLALEKIRTKELYRADFATFDEYLGTRWRMTRQHALRLIDAAQVARELSPTGYKPANENQARSLATLPPEQRQEVWQEAIAAAGGQPTPATVAAAVSKRRPKKSRRPKAIRVRVPGAIVIITPNKAFTDPLTALRDAATKLAEQASKAA